MEIQSIEANLELAGRIKGFLNPEEARRLYEVGCEAAQLGPCLEIGSYCGKSALFLGAACRSRGSTLFSIDHHSGSEEQQPGEAYFDPELFDPHMYAVNTLGHFRQTLRLAGLEDTVVPLVARSAVAARDWATPLGLVFIDGAHDLESVRQDYLCWRRHIVANGFLVIHDIFSDPAEGGQAPYQIYGQALESADFRALPMTKTLGVLQKNSQ